MCGYGNVLWIIWKRKHSFFLPEIYFTEKSDTFEESITDNFLVLVC